SLRTGETLVKGLVVSVLLILPVWGVWETYSRVDMSDDYRGRKGIETVVRNVPQDATVLHHRSNLWYMILVEKRRRDLTLVDPFQHSKEFPYNDIVWPADLSLPETDRRFGTDDLSGVKSARIALENGPVYLFAQEEARPSNFRKAGFDVTQVEGSVYRIEE
ncbi:MAG: protein O-mannosyl-transferase family, partial [Rubrobacteraceae bacterium]